jgi:hypothetical protein
MAPRYLETFRQAVRAGSGGEKSVLSEKSPTLISLTSLISHPGPFAKVLGALESRCPDYVDTPRWQHAVEDAKTFVATWGEQAAALGWSNRDLFGLHDPPTNPHPSYSRLSRYDCTGLVWLLHGRPVVALTEATAAIENTTGNITVYRRYNKPGLGPLGDSLEDLK